MMEEEPFIITILKADHVDGYHKDANKYCPLCREEQISLEVEEYLKEVQFGNDNNN